MPRPFPVACHDPAPQHRACGDDSERRGGSSRGPPRPELPHVALQEGAARLIRRRHNQQLGCCWRSIARTSSRGRLSGRSARCGWSRPAPPQAAAVAAAGEAHLRSLVHSSKDAIRPAAALGLKTRSALGGASSPAGQSSSLAIVLLRVAQHLLQGALTFCSLSPFAHFCSLLLTFAHFLLTFGSRFAEFLLNLAHICTFSCPFSAHFLLIVCSLSPHVSSLFGSFWRVT